MLKQLNGLGAQPSLTAKYNSAAPPTASSPMGGLTDVMDQPIAPGQPAELSPPPQGVPGSVPKDINQVSPVSTEPSDGSGWMAQMAAGTPEGELAKKKAMSDPWTALAAIVFNKQLFGDQGGQ